MGILNVTPDSFSDGGRFTSLDAALTQTEHMIADGASWIDVGGESTRPGAEPVSVQDELDRVIPVIEAIRSRFDVAISLDTIKPAVMQAGIAAGVSMINDVKALQEEGALHSVVNGDVKLCLMHMQGEPRSMQSNPQYDNVTQDVKAFLKIRADACIAAGVSVDRIVIDPGFGFGKTVQHNFQLTHQLAQLAELGYPILVGWSRKSSLGAVTGREVGDRLPASIAAALLCAERGAAIIRVHDVAATVDALKIRAAVNHWERL